MNELVSVIMPTFNRAATISRSITSVLNQSYSALELIIVDDGSTDDTSIVVASFTDKRLRYFKLDQNVGGSGARNFGIKKANGNFIAFQDSDDEWLVNKLRSDIKIFDEDANIDCVFSRYWQIDGLFSKVVPSSYLTVSDSLSRSLLVRNLIGTPTVILKRDVLRRVNGFNMLLPRYQDWELFIRISREFKIHMNTDINVIAYVSGDSLSNNNLAHLTALRIIYDAHIHEISKSDELKSLWLWKIGCAEAINSKKFRRTLLESLMLQFSVIKVIKFGLISILGTKGYIAFSSLSGKVIKLISGSRLSAWLKGEDF